MTRKVFMDSASVSKSYLPDKLIESQYINNHEKIILHQNGRCIAPYYPAYNVSGFVRNETDYCYKLVQI